MSDLKPPTVVNVHTGAPFDVYGGRAARFARNPQCRHESIYANPFRIRTGISRAKVIADYEELWRLRLEGPEKEVWLDHLRALTNKSVGCWCTPKPCHVDVLIQLWHEYIGGDPS